VVSSNIVGAENELFTGRPYVILTVNQLRVAVLGALTDDMRNLSTPKLMQQWHTVPVLATVRRYAAELKEKSDIVVLLGHLTAEEELQFLDNVPEVPVIVSGHVHTGLNQAISRDNRVMVRMKGYGEELGRLDLKVDTAAKAPASWTWKRIPIDSTKIAPAEDVAAQVKRWEDEVTARVDEPLATAGHAFDKRQLKAVMEQAMRDETGADFAFMNAGGVRDVLPQGRLLVRHIWNIMPFDNVVVIAHVPGRDLPKVVLGGRTVEPDRVYTLAVSDFTAQNQSAAGELGTTGLVFGDDVGLLRDMLVDWFRKKKVIE
jgi:2',3'-cyclic-nucleotide 2'-phosphodiesterase (5'-nucleotidase family)